MSKTFIMPNLLSVFEGKVYMSRKSPEVGQGMLDFVEDLRLLSRIILPRK